ncbi:neuronal PAS domain-containing protein 1 [Cricetulus griseus]|nr:neuronal PAS domain-containing protein 1 [Cricetulus griseus]
MLSRASFKGLVLTSNSACALLSWDSISGICSSGNGALPSCPHDDVHTARATGGVRVAKSLDGFVFALNQEGKFLYISETVSIYLGLSQVELTGSSVFDYVHPGDHVEMAEQLGMKLPPGRGLLSQGAAEDAASSASSSSQSETPEPGGEINTTLGFRQFSETYETVFGVKNNYSSMVNHWLSKTEAIMFCLKFQTPKNKSEREKEKVKEKEKHMLGRVLEEKKPLICPWQWAVLTIRKRKQEEA